MAYPITGRPLKYLSGLLGLGIATGILLACSPKAPVRIGLVAGLSGRNVDLGEGGRNGALLAIEQRNQSGGINGHPIEIIVKDDGNDAQKAAQAARELIHAKVELVIGPFNSSMSAAMLPLMNHARVVLLSPTATALNFVGKDDYFIRTNWTTRDNARFYANWIAEKKQFRTIALAYDLQNQVFTESWVNEFRAAYEALGGKIVSRVAYDARIAAHYTQIVDALVPGKPDCLLFVSNSPDTARLAQHVRKRNRDIPLFSSEWAEVDKIMEIGGAAVENMTIAQAFDHNDPSPRYQQFVADYKTRFKQEPSYTSVAAFDATRLALEALGKKTGTESTKQAILAHGAYQGLQKPILLDPFGDAQQRAFMTVIQNGKTRILP